MSRAITCLTLVAIIGLPCLDARARRPAQKLYQGKILTDVAPYPASWTDEQEFSRYLRKHNQPIFRTGDDGDWEIHLLSFFKPIGKTRCEVVFYDITKPGKKKFVHHVPHGITRNQTSLFTSLRLEKDTFTKNHKYEVRVTRMVNGKEKVFARTKISLR